VHIWGFKKWDFVHIWGFKKWDFVHGSVISVWNGVFYGMVRLVVWWYRDWICSRL